MPTKKPSFLSKIKTRPLTNSEKVLLTLLAIVGIAWLGNRYILVPQEQKQEELTVQKYELETKIMEMNATLRREADIKAEWEQLHREKNQIISYYFPTLDQSQIIYLLNDTLPEDQVEIVDLNFTRPGAEKVADMDVYNMGISVPFSGSYAGIMNMVRAVEMSPRRMMVDTLSLDRRDDASLGGTMNIKVYSLQGLAEADPNVIPVEVADNPNTGTLFGSFAGFTGGTSSGSSGGGSTGGGGTAGGGGTEPVIELKGDILHSFEMRNYDFVPSHELIAGSAVPSTIAQHGKYGMRLEYKILGVSDENRAYVDISKQNIELRYPPNELKMWVYSFDYSPGNIGIRAVTQSGEEVEQVISIGVPWLGWGNLSVMLPGDTSIYPLKITHIYYEMGKERDDFGVLIFDKMEAFFSNHTEGMIQDEKIRASDFIFYEVQPGDTITGISRKIYGTEKYKSEIMTNNEIKSGDILTVGKILVLVKR